MKVHEGDMVQVIRGRDKGISGKVIAVDHEKNIVTVEGVNRVYKHVKPSQKNPQGGTFAQGDADSSFVGYGTLPINE